MTKRHLRQIIAFTLISMYLPHSAWAAVAGRFQFVVGDVRIISADGRERTAIKGGEVNEKESILSGKTGSAQLRMIDDGIVAVRPETALRIDEYKFADKEDGTERGFFSLLKGGFRSITGLIGRGNKDNYGIRTPSATIGIRGTDHETVHLTTALPNLPEGTYNKVNTGATVVNGTLVGANQVAYTPTLGTPASILPHIPPIFEAPKGGQQGRDDRKRDTDKTEGRQQAKDEKKQEAGQKPANGQPAPATAPATAPTAAPTDGGAPPPLTPVNGTTQPPPPPVGGPMPPPPPQNLLGNILLPPPPPPSNPIVPTSPIPGSGTILAPIGTGGVGGDISIRTEWNGTANVTGAFAGGGGIVVEGPDQTILFDATTKLPVLVAEQSTYGSMKYSAGPLQMIDVGQTMVGTAKVMWGRYVGAGDQFVDPMGTRDPITMNLMFTDQAMNFLQANAYFTANPAATTFNIEPGAGNVVDNLGSIYSASGTLKVTGAGSVELGIAASNGTRTWGLGYSGTVQQFYQNNCTSGPCGLQLTNNQTLTGSPTLTGAGAVTLIKGQAGGVFIGPNAAGALTSYGANAFDASGALIGSLQGTSLFKR